MHFVPLKNFILLSAAEIIEQPFFDDISPRNVTTVVDDTVVLKCRVKNKGNRTVSTLINISNSCVTDYYNIKFNQLNFK